MKVSSSSGMIFSLPPCSFSPDVNDCSVGVCTHRCGVGFERLRPVNRCATRVQGVSSRCKAERPVGLSLEGSLGPEGGRHTAVKGARRTSANKEEIPDLRRRVSAWDCCGKLFHFCFEARRVKRLSSLCTERSDVFVIF